MLRQQNLLTFLLIVGITAALGLLCFGIAMTFAPHRDSDHCDSDQCHSTYNYEGRRHYVALTKPEYDELTVAFQSDLLAEPSRFQHLLPAGYRFESTPAGRRLVDRQGEPIDADYLLQNRLAAATIAAGPFHGCRLVPECTYQRYGAVVNRVHGGQLPCLVSSPTNLPTCDFAAPEDDPRELKRFVTNGYIYRSVTRPELDRLHRRLGSRFANLARYLRHSPADGLSHVPDNAFDFAPTPNPGSAGAAPPAN